MADPPIRPVATDDQTGKPYEIEREKWWDTISAVASAMFLVATLAVLLWLLFDIWAGNNTLFAHFGYAGGRLESAAFHLFAYVAIGGAMGATVDGIRMNIVWHAERGAYGHRFLLRDLALPLLGMAVGLFAYVILRSGVGVIAGDLNSTSGTQG